jgi:hypothetical protein
MASHSDLTTLVDEIKQASGARSQAAMPLSIGVSASLKIQSTNCIEKRRGPVRRMSPMTTPLSRASRPSKCARPGGR